LLGPVSQIIDFEVGGCASIEIGRGFIAAGVLGEILFDAGIEGFSEVMNEPLMIKGEKIGLFLA